MADSSLLNDLEDASAEDLLAAAEQTVGEESEEPVKLVVEEIEQPQEPIPIPRPAEEIERENAAYDIVQHLVDETIFALEPETSDVLAPFDATTVDRMNKIADRTLKFEPLLAYYEEHMQIPEILAMAFYSEDTTRGNVIVHTETETKVIDARRARNTFARVFKFPGIEELCVRALKNLLEKIPGWLASPEVQEDVFQIYRLYIVLLLIPFPLEYGHIVEEILPAIYSTILELSLPIRCEIGKLICRELRKIDESFVLHIIALAQQVISKRVMETEYSDQFLHVDDPVIQTATKFLQILYANAIACGITDREFNEKAVPSGPKMSCNEIYEHLDCYPRNSIEMAIDSKKFANLFLSEFVREEEDIGRMLDIEHPDTFSFLKYPFIFDITKKAKCISHFCKIEMFKAVRKIESPIGENIRIHNKITLNRTIVTRSVLTDEEQQRLKDDPSFQAELDRRRYQNECTYLSTALEKVGNMEEDHIFRPLYVEYEDEPGIDAGGLTKEFIDEVSTYVCETKATPAIRPLTEEETLKLCCVNELHNDNGVTWSNIASVMALGLINGTVGNWVFPRAYFRLLLGAKPTIHDTYCLFICTGAQMQIYKAKSIKYWSIYNAVGVGPVPKNPMDRAEVPPIEELTCDDIVYDEHKLAFLQGSTEIFLGSRNVHICKFKETFRTIMANVPYQDIATTPEELDEVICGNVEINRQDWEACAHYKDCSPEHPSVIMFWSVVNDLNDEDVKTLFLFTSGYKRVPAGGFKSCNPPPTVNCIKTDITGYLRLISGYFTKIR